ncbi:hypothetical protein LIA77_10277 [Sarocladium implicatum]|nr:hypothetical protein LIA77_10277 [Sarocladium implicatum]
MRWHCIARHRDMPVTVQRFRKPGGQEENIGRIPIWACYAPHCSPESLIRQRRPQQHLNIQSWVDTEPMSRNTVWLEALEDVSLVHQTLEVDKRLDVDDHQLLLVPQTLTGQPVPRSTRTMCPAFSTGMYPRCASVGSVRLHKAFLDKICNMVPKYSIRGEEPRSLIMVCPSEVRCIRAYSRPILDPTRNLYYTDFIGPSLAADDCVDRFVDTSLQCIAQST